MIMMSEYPATGRSFSPPRRPLEGACRQCGRPRYIKRALCMRCDEVRRFLCYGLCERCHTRPVICHGMCNSCEKKRQRAQTLRTTFYGHPESADDFVRSVEYLIEQLTCCLLESWESFAAYEAHGTNRREPCVVEILTHLGHAQVLTAHQYRYVVRQVNANLDGVYRLMTSYWGEKEQR